MFKSPIRIILVLYLVATDKVLLNIFAKFSVKCNDESGGLRVLHKIIFLDFFKSLSKLIQYPVVLNLFYVQSRVCPKYKGQRLHHYQSFYFYKFSGTPGCRKFESCQCVCVFRARLKSRYLYHVKFCNQIKFCV